jgi:hypothetical protein
MGHRRRRRTRSDEGGNRIDIDRGPQVAQLRRSPYTVEGIIEAYGTLARWAIHPPSPHSRRAIARDMAPSLLAAMAAFVVILAAVWLLIAAV